MAKEATLKQKRAIHKVLENGGNVSRAMRESGYSPATAKNPKKLTESKAWDRLVERFLPDQHLAEKHRELLNASRLDHMVFPLGPIDDLSNAEEGDNREDDVAERTTLTDKEIIKTLADVNCKVRRIVHGQMARHVYFWAADNKARKEALDMAYNLKGKYPKSHEDPLESARSAIINILTFVQNGSPRIVDRSSEGTPGAPVPGRRGGSSGRRQRCLITGIPLICGAETPFMLPIV